MNKSYHFLKDHKFFQNARKLIVAGHRGGNFDYENSMATFHEAVKHKIKSVEFDVWLTKDRVPILIHGGSKGELQHECLDSSITSDSLINNLDYDEIKHIKLPNGESIPTFEGFIDEFKDKLDFIIDLKDANPVACEILVDMIVNKICKIPFIKSDEGYEHETSIEIFSVHRSQIDFLSSILKENSIYHEFTKSIKIGYCFWSNDTFLQNYDWNKHNKIELAFGCINKETVEMIQHANKMEVNAFFMPYEPETQEAYDKLISMGVDCIETDHPQELNHYISTLLAEEDLLIDH